MPAKRTGGERRIRASARSGQHNGSVQRTLSSNAAAAMGTHVPGPLHSTCGRQTIQTRYRRYVRRRRRGPSLKLRTTALYHVRLEAPHVCGGHQGRVRRGDDRRHPRLADFAAPRHRYNLERLLLCGDQRQRLVTSAGQAR